MIMFNRASNDGRTFSFTVLKVWSDKQMAMVLRRIAALCLAALCAAAGGSTASDTLILGSRVSLGPIEGVPTNLGYSPVSALIADLNGDGAPDIAVGINGGPPVVYLNNGTATPFQGVPGVFVASPPGPNSAGISCRISSRLGRTPAGKITSMCS